MATKEHVALKAVETKVSYDGLHVRIIDGGRIIIPPEWRSQSDVATFVVSLWPILSREYVKVVPLARWADYLKNLNERQMTASRASFLKTLFGVYASKRPIDSNGRLLLPEPAMQLLGSYKEVKMVGCDETFEIWPPDKLDSTLKKESTPELEEILESVRI
jgi:DNA-binding transcriptional regulator/RsmH inhibitor MraZ